jgi:hypothetical protein
MSHNISFTTLIWGSVTIADTSPQGSLIAVSAENLAQPYCRLHNRMATALKGQSLSLVTPNTLKQAFYGHP